MVMSSAWPMCRLPVTLGGGITMQNGAASGSRANTPSGAKAPDASQAA